MGERRTLRHGTFLPDLIDGGHAGGKRNGCKNGHFVVGISGRELRNLKAQAALLHSRRREVDAGSVNMREARGVPVGYKSLRAKHGEGIWVNGPSNPLIGRGGRASEGHPQGGVGWMIGPMEERVEDRMIHTGRKDFIAGEIMVCASLPSGREAEREEKQSIEEALEFGFHGGLE